MHADDGGHSERACRGRRHGDHPGVDRAGAAAAGRPRFPMHKKFLTLSATAVAAAIALAGYVVHRIR